ncbi:hypothetical protein HZB02_00100 [Candidatus Woesearchaeota archaeon]|nr:hypothetical protein [Candidatus Woesearchaeota archaeon]
MDINKIRCEICNTEFGSQEAIDSHNKSKHQTLAPEKSHRFSLKMVSIISIILLVIFGVAALSVMGHKSSIIDGNVIKAPDNVQIATLRVSGSSYILEPSTFKKDVPVKIIANIESMPGCSKGVTIPELNIFKGVSNEDNTITFTPTKTGTFRMACTMNMYRTTFTVE